eukprot:gnl/TRDRNA2_/TRDRNA2_37118_c0_seq1.p1 gnl/TRDRNA2_/TRDRNA2_37118_c0~~gnl/TRDRNA2_/TRDRNA2_37118_c0_seq1.p1  ORF type:complete len:232 (+),score=32.92 gnl/TRDRNA2_/TRDRNA2_37118_c0_seq1:30-725(+)
MQLLAFLLCASASALVLPEKGRSQVSPKQRMTLLQDSARRHQKDSRFDGSRESRQHRLRGGELRKNVPASIERIEKEVADLKDQIRHDRHFIQKESANMKDAADAISMRMRGGHGNVGTVGEAHRMQHRHTSSTAEASYEGSDADQPYVDPNGSVTIAGPTTWGSSSYGSTGPQYPPDPLYDHIPGSKWTDSYAYDKDNYLEEYMSPGHPGYEYTGGDSYKGVDNFAGVHG